MTIPMSFDSSFYDHWIMMIVRILSDFGFYGPADKSLNLVRIIGILMWEISSGQPPFINKHNYEIGPKITRNSYNVGMQIEKGDLIFNFSWEFCQSFKDLPECNERTKDNTSCPHNSIWINSEICGIPYIPIYPTRKNGKLGGKAMELEGPEDARIMKPNHKAVKEVDSKETLPISDEQLAEWAFTKRMRSK
ncbi:hypothetical protein RhiirC2_775801 [Rhizophagus irregularis]|uniref:Uncharacterized protein n=1 Tax=Rhizophagus irregularis TaxID=588596 RepID=A0A2N1NIG2_9GLOM|nr:hypothetical protein RhiirC2_775801 [Rhizophagus irregularis]